MVLKKKTKAVAVCNGCGHPIPVRVCPNGDIQPFGSHGHHNQDCAGEGYRVLAGNTPDG